MDHPTEFPIVLKTIRIFDREFSYWPEVSEQSLVALLVKIDFSLGDGPGACWPWTAALDERGYGVCHWGSGPARAHRAVYLALVGPFPLYYHLHHRCEVPNCVNPDHLQPLPPAEHWEITGNAITHAYKGQTHCKHGHLLSPDNLIQSEAYPTHRRCKTCLREWDRRRYVARKKQEEERTHCRNGHLLSIDNVYIYGGIKFCTACRNINSAEYYARNKAIQAGGLTPKKIHNADKQVCSRGHAYDEENTSLVQKGGRQPSRVCIICRDTLRKIKYYRKTDDPNLADRLEQALNANANKDTLESLTHKTHCPVGHEYTPENTYLYERPGKRVFRVCKTCAQTKSQAAYYRDKEKRGKLTKDI